MTNPEPNPIWSDPTASPVDPLAPPPVDAPTPPVDGPAPSAYQPPTFEAPVPFVSPDAAWSGDFSPSAAPVPAPGTPAVGYGLAPYPAPAAGATYAGYGAPAYPGYPPPGYAPPGYPPPGYPATGYPVSGYPAPGYSPYGPPPRRTSGLATASMVLSIVGMALILCYGFGGLLGLTGAIMGHVARRRIRASQEGGDGMAKAGFIVGWIVLGLTIAFWGLAILGMTIDA